MIPRVLFQGGSRSVLRVSRPGFNVLTATLSQLAFDAEGAQFAIIARGSILLPNPGANNTTTVGVGFEAQSRIPFALCWYQEINTTTGQPTFEYAYAPYRWFRRSPNTNVAFEEMQIFSDHLIFSAKFFQTGLILVAGYIVFRQVD